MNQCRNLCPVKENHVCCFFCTDKGACAEICEQTLESCSDKMKLETALTPIEEKTLPIMQKIKDIVSQKKALEAQEKDMKDKLKAAMEECGVKMFDNDLLKVTYIAATTATSIDSAKLKKKYPAIAEECSKTSAKSAYVKVEIKE